VVTSSSKESQQFEHLDTLNPESSYLASYFIKTSFVRKKLSCKTFFFFWVLHRRTDNLSSFKFCRKSVFWSCVSHSFKMNCQQAVISTS